MTIRSSAGGNARSMCGRPDRVAPGLLAGRHQIQEGVVTRKLLAAGGAVLLALALVGPISAITNGVPDGDDHPYVALMVAQDATGKPMWRCSGSLISEDLFLTAGHCTDGAIHVEIWFDKGPVPTAAGYPVAGADPCAGINGYPCTGDVGGTPHTNPLYQSEENPYGGGNGLPAFSYRDVGVVVLDESHPMSTYAQLPTAGLVDTLPSKAAIDFVGYGVQEQIMAFPGQPPRARWGGPRTRMYAPGELVSGNFVHSAEYIRSTLNPGGGKGGTCFGDSGGPDLLGGTRTVLSVNSYVTNVNCSGVGYGARIDVPEVLDWIEGYMD